MITSSFTGNLGNHMWIYAMTRAVAEKNGYEWGFNPSPEFDYHDGKPQMDFMDIDYGKTHEFKYGETPPWIQHTWSEKYLKIIHPNRDTVDYHPYQPEIFDIKDDTKLFIRCCQDARYLKPIKKKVAEWFKIKDREAKGYNFLLNNKQVDIHFDEDTCFANVRGGEYKGVSNLLIQQKYWTDAVDLMKSRNPNMKFVCVTDDIDYARKLFPPETKTVHIDIGGDYYMINHAKNLILSNSSFAIFPAWLNENNPYVIAPFGWARHNVTTGYWANSAIWTFPWNFLDRDKFVTRNIKYEDL